LDHIRVLSFWIKRGYDSKKAEKHFLEDIRPSVRPPLIVRYASVRHPSVRPYPRFILTQTRIWSKNRFSALFKSYPRFIQKDKTRIWSKKRFSALFKSYPRFIQKDKTRILSKKRFPAFF
jgi:hypothetical protein